MNKGKRIINAWVLNITGKWISSEEALNTIGRRIANVRNTIGRITSDPNITDRIISSEVLSTRSKKEIS
jgi:hypothetical protein